MNRGSLLAWPIEALSGPRPEGPRVRSRIIDAALALISEGGYVSAQIAAVAERARVAVGTVYRHFPSKSDLFAEVFRRASRREVDAMRAGAAATEGGSAADRIMAGTETLARRAPGRPPARLGAPGGAGRSRGGGRAPSLPAQLSGRDRRDRRGGRRDRRASRRTRRRPPPPWSARSESRCSGPSPHHERRRSRAGDPSLISFCSRAIEPPRCGRGHQRNGAESCRRLRSQPE